LNWSTVKTAVLAYYVWFSSQKLKAGGTFIAGIILGNFGISVGSALLGLLL
jgi:hypothetical protein